jgi:hypothetical protein
VTDKDDHKAGCCGDYCGKCPNYTVECAGCVPEDHTDCHFVKCCLDKGIEHCGLCGDFPCRKIKEFVPDDRPGCPAGYHIEELYRRKGLGTPAWLEAQRRKWEEAR